MDNDAFLKFFRREEDGTWTCARSMEMKNGGTHIVMSAGTNFGPGTVMGGMDMFAWLEKLAAEHPELVMRSTSGK